MRFREAVRTVGKALLSEKGFIYHTEPGMHVFTRRRKDGLHECIAFYTSRDKNAFTTELGVTLDPENFGGTFFSEEGRWHNFGLRIRLGEAIHGNALQIHSYERDFSSFENQQTLLEALRQAIDQALLVGPQVWSRFASRLADSATTG